MAPLAAGLLLCTLARGGLAEGLHAAWANVSFGMLRGTSLPGAAVEEFLDVPFAEPPVGKLRFAPPVDWSRAYAGGSREAQTYGPRCPQPQAGLGAPRQDEDCLHLNVWRPGGAAGLPVLVFIFGGSFFEGAADMYNGSRLAADAGAVVVGMNYRLGALGWALLPGAVGGNFGLLDQQSALRWVQREARALGGDPEKVLLFGQSAGSESTALQLLLPESRGLFSAALLESGPTEAVPQDFALRCGQRLAELLGCGAGHAQLQCLRGKAWQQLLAAQGRLLAVPPNKTQWDVTCAFWSAVDGVTLPRHPEELLKEGLAVDVPVVAGVNRDEGAVFAYLDWAERPLGRAQFRGLASKLLKARGRSERPGDAERLEAAYLPSSGGEDFRPQLGRLFSDFLFVCKTRRFLRLLTARPGRASPASKYVFAQRAAADPSPGTWGVYHSAELPFVFGSGETGSIQQVPSLLPAEERLAGFMRHAWARLARRGDPGTGWPAYETAQDPHLELKVGGSPVQHRFHEAQCDAWDGIWNRYLPSPPILPAELLV